jgi:uncharacterized protein (DUF1330 family)
MIPACRCAHRGYPYEVATPAVVASPRVINTLNAWYKSPEYQPLIALRRASAKDMLITLEGA